MHIMGKKCSSNLAGTDRSDLKINVEKPSINNSWEAQTLLKVMFFGSKIGLTFSWAKEVINDLESGSPEMTV